MTNRLELYTELLELSVKVKIQGGADVALLISETARCILLECETAGANALRRVCETKRS